MINDEQGQLLTVREVARRCNRSEETVRRWIWSGKLTARKLGNQLFVEEGGIPGMVAAPQDRMTFVAPPKLSPAEFQDLLARQKQLRDELFEKHGYFDSAELVRESREGH